MIEKEARAVGRLARTLRGGGPLRDEPRAIAETAPARLEPPRAIEGPAAAEDSSRFSIPGDEVAGAATSLPSGEGGERQRAGWGRFEAAEIQADPLRRAFVVASFDGRCSPSRLARAVSLGDSRTRAAAAGLADGGCRRSRVVRPHVDPRKAGAVRVMGEFAWILG
jgi:hypothetical protein